MGSLRQVWWLAPIGALCCALIMGGCMAGQVAGEAEDGATVALAAAGLDSQVSYAGVDGFDGLGSDGLNITLEGPSSVESAAVAAVEDRDEINRVNYVVTTDDIDQTPSGDTDEETSTEDDEASAEDDEADGDPALDLDPAAVTATIDGDTVTLQGTVADDATRQALISATVNEFGAANVSHDITVDPENVTLDGGTITVAGGALTEAQQQGWLTTAETIAGETGLSVIDETTLMSVDQALNDLFSLEPIEFDVSQATIRPRSRSTLDAAAEMINANPDAGSLLVIGHTDGDGSAEANRRLSQARADAVVAYLVDEGGVDGERLQAEGRGESELLVDPETSPEDKQRNRRIEWELVS